MSAWILDIPTHLKMSAFVYVGRGRIFSHKSWSLYNYLKKNNLYALSVSFLNRFLFQPEANYVHISFRKSSQLSILSFSISTDEVFTKWCFLFNLDDPVLQENLIFIPRHCITLVIVNEKSSLTLTDKTSYLLAKAIKLPLDLIMSARYRIHLEPSINPSN